MAAWSRRSAPTCSIEYGHRLVAAALTSVLLVATDRRPACGAPPAPGTARLGTALLVLLAVQILLGGITVLLGLPRPGQHRPPRERAPDLRRAPRPLRKLRGAAADAPARGGGRRDRTRLARRRAGSPPPRWGLCSSQLALGGYVRHSGAGLACPDFPLCSGERLPAHAGWPPCTGCTAGSACCSWALSSTWRRGGGRAALRRPRARAGPRSRSCRSRSASRPCCSS